MLFRTSGSKGALRLPCFELVVRAEVLNPPRCFYQQNDWRLSINWRACVQGTTYPNGVEKKSMLERTVAERSRTGGGGVTETNEP